MEGNPLHYYKFYGRGRKRNLTFNLLDPDQISPAVPNNVIPREGGVRIMDLNQYLERMNTNTKII